MEERQKAINTRNLGFIAEDLSYSPIFTNSYFAYILDGILEAAGLQGWSTTIFIQRMWHTNIGQAIRRNYDGRCDGLLLMAPAFESETVSMLYERGVPMVMIGASSWIDSISSVDIDNRSTGAAAVNYLIERGHRRIGYIAGGSKNISSREREEGYVKALTEAGIVGRPQWIFSRSELREGWPESFADVFLSMPHADRPTALVGWNDVLASQAISALSEGGISVPKDVSVISIDDGPEASRSNPPLTTFRQPLQLIGKRSVELLIDHIGDGGRFAETVRFSTHLVERSSVASLKQM
jgi:LacI family transcriptional regulator